MNATIEELLARLEQLEARVDEHSLFPGASADVLFLLVASLNVFFMQCGFGMLEAGSVTSRSTQAILLKNLLDACLSAFIWWVMGHGIAFDGTNDFIGTAGSDMSSFFLSGYGSGPDSGYHRVFWWFQWTFAAAAATIVSGAVAERTHLLAYLSYTVLITILIYPVIVHWVWSAEGWLSASNADAFQGGVIDFAGSGVVHLTGGTAGLCGAVIIGPRNGRFQKLPEGGLGVPLPMPGHAPVLQVLGTFILWLGWYGFNAGSRLTLSSGDDSAVVGRIVANTTIAASTSGLTALLATLAFSKGRGYDVATMCNGILSGLVSVTAGCATLPLWGALIVGAIGGLVNRGFGQLVLRLKVDDPLEASSVHGACGAWGVIGAAIFSIDSATQVAYPERNGGSGGLVSGHGDLLAAAVVQVLCIICWTGSFSTALFLTLKKFNVLRRPDSYGAAAMDEDLDATIHEGMPYIDPSAAASRASSTATTADPVDASKA
mmetsp:Transcript_37826/g.125357  ORF Transcript_37826/g.125357 Transcript_37826/m.125357 type:complete len:489 (-) Transcript_37826:241-1707(-)